MSEIKRVNVGFGSGTGGGRDFSESTRGPLRIVVVSGLSADGEYSTRATPPLNPIPIDKLSFDRVMGQLAPSLSVSVRDPFLEDGEPFAVELRWTELKGLRPDAIADQVSALRALVEARKVVLAVRARQVSAEDARAQLGRILPRRAWADALTADAFGVTSPVARSTAPPVSASPAQLAAAAAPKPKSRGDALDALFEKVAVKGDAPAANEAPEASETRVAPSGLSAIVAAVAKGTRGGSAHPKAVVGTALERVERAFTRIVGDIVRHPEVRRLESAWRGLRLLVDHAESRAGIEIDVLPAHKSRVADALRTLAEPSAANESRAPADVVVVDHEIGASLDDTRLLASWAALAREMHTPIVVNGHASLLGLEAIDALPKASKRLVGYDDPRPADARSAAADDACRWAAVAMNGPLVRAAYTPSTSRLREIPFTEDAKDRKCHVFAGPAIAIGVLCAQSYLRLGWPTEIVGPQHGAVPNLPVHEVEDAGHAFAIPLEVFVGDDVLKEAARAGICVFGCAANHDAAVLHRAPVFHKRVSEAQRSPAGAAPDTTLADQLFVGRFANAVQQVAAALPPSVDAAKGAEVARMALMELFANAPPAGPEVDARIAGHRLEVTVRPRRFAGVSLAEFALTAPLSG